MLAQTLAQSTTQMPAITRVDDNTWAILLKSGFYHGYACISPQNFFPIKILLLKVIYYNVLKHPKKKIFFDFFVFV